MARKIDSGIVANFSLSIEGNQLVIAYLGKEAFRLNLKLLSTAFADLGVYLGETAGKKIADDGEESLVGGAEKAKFTAGDVTKFIQVYQGLQKKYTGKFSNYPPTGKFWKAFEKATAQALENKLDFNTYLNAIIAQYTRRMAGGQVVFPYPNQLSGEYAQTVIVDQTGRGSAKAIPDSIRADKLASTNRYLSVDKDQAYQEAYYRVKAGNGTRFDFEYMKARQTQLLGQPKDWLIKREKIFNDKEAANDNQE